MGRRAGRSVPDEDWSKPAARAGASATYHLAALESEPSHQQKPAPAPADRAPPPVFIDSGGARSAIAPPSPVPVRAVPSKGGGDPTVAGLLSWLIPGAGHLYLGQAGIGLFCFVVIQGIYLLGLKLSDGMGFEYLDLELRSLFAPALSPEVGNLGAFVYQMQHYGFGPGFARPYPEWLRLGATLTALSGVLNIAVIVHAHWCARTSIRAATGVPAPYLAVLATLAVPGLGHWLQGRRQRAVVVFTLLVGLFVLGTVLAEATNLSRERHFYYWSGQFLVGLPAILAEAMWGTASVKRDISYVDAGLVFACVAGMLNTLAMIDVYGFSESKLLGLPLRTSHATAKVSA